MAKVKNWAYPLDNIGKPTPPVKKAVAPKMATGQSINDYLNEIDKAYYQNPPAPSGTYVGNQGVAGSTVYVNTGTWTSNGFIKPAPWPAFFEEPVQDEWSPTPPPIKTIPPKPVPGRLYKVINTGARVPKSTHRLFVIKVANAATWESKHSAILDYLENTSAKLNPVEDDWQVHIVENGTLMGSWEFTVEDMY